MKISIITPSLNQLDWLRMCVASVADQIAPEVQGAESRVESRESRAALETQAPSSQIQSSAQSPLSIEHIIQDGGTPGIEDFAREVGAEFYRDGKLVFGARPSIDGTLLPQSRTALTGPAKAGSTAPIPSGLVFDPRPYRLAIYSEADAGMYDAINKGIAKISGDLWAWLNCDEQYLPCTLAYVAEWFGNHPDVDILCGDAVLTDDEGRAVSYRRIVVPGYLHIRLDHLASLSCSSFYRRGVLERGGIFDTAWRSIGDAEWIARLLRKGMRAKGCGKLLASYAFTGVNTSESPAAFAEGKRWMAQSDAPPSWLKRPVILLYRMKKMLAGAYRKRTLTYSLHGKNGSGRVTRRAKNLGWGWGGIKS